MKKVSYDRNKVSETVCVIYFDEVHCIMNKLVNIVKWLLVMKVGQGVSWGSSEGCVCGAGWDP